LTVGVGGFSLTGSDDENLKHAQGRCAMYRNPASDTISLIARPYTIAKTLVVISVSALLAASNFGLANLSADESPAALCSARVRQFVKEMDIQLGEKRDKSLSLDDLIEKYLPAKACDIDEIILIAKQSKFFWFAHDEGEDYAIGFKNARVEVTFGLQKRTGDIVFPSAMPRPRSM
jgi:hypothetical protein